MLTVLLASVVVSAGLVAVSGRPAQAQLWYSNFVNCVGPYTSGYGTSRAAGAHISDAVYHYRHDASGDTLKAYWTFVSTSYSYRTSHNHGAGSQSFAVVADLIDSANSRIGCEYVG